MKISLYGAGYVGLVTSVCFADLGHSVCCVDINEQKVTRLNSGDSPIYEKNLTPLLQKNLAAKRIFFTSHISEAVNYSEIQIVSVGTPTNPDGSSDTQYVIAAAKEIAQVMTHYQCIVIKSTVPTGTANELKIMIDDILKKRRVNIPFDIVSNPEFLREGQAIQDCLSPERIIIGSDSEKAITLMQALYRPLIEKGYPLLIMDTTSAELTKYAANAFLATKVSFMNEMSQIAERVGANIHHIKKGIGSDSRINEKFLNAGCGFGGSCFPKDISALKHIAQTHEYEPHILNAVLHTNQKQQALLFKKISNYFHAQLSGKTIALWGLAFKPNTDDIRCATSHVLIEALLKSGVVVRAYDPAAMQNMADAYCNEKNLILCDNASDTLTRADALCVATEWDEFKNIHWTQIKNTLKNPVVFDGRNIWDRKTVENHGLIYFGIGC